MDFNIVDKLDNLWKKLKEIGVFKQICKIPDFLIHPRQFWQDYESLSAKDKAVQFVTFGSLFAFAIWLASYDDLSSGDLLKIVAMEIAAMFVYAVIIYTANSIVKKSWNKVWFFFVLCCYVKFICIIPQIIALRAYYDRETPLLMAFFFIIPLIAELLLLFYSAYVVQSGKHNVILAIVVSVLFLNVYDCVFIATGWPMSNNTNFENKIAKERFVLGKAIKNAYDIPYCVASRNNGEDYWYFFSDPIDSVASIKFEDSNQYIEVVKEDMDSLRAITGRCLFSSNRDFFHEMYVLKNDVVYVHETKMYRHSPIIKQTDIMIDSTIVDRILYQEFNRDLQERNNQLFESEIKQAEQFEKARSVQNLGALWHPCLFIYSFCLLNE